MLFPSDATVSRPRVRAAAEQAGGPAGGGRQGGAEAAGQADNLSHRGQDNILDIRIYRFLHATGCDHR